MRKIITIHLAENVMDYTDTIALLNYLRHMLGDNTVSEMEKQDSN